jgi:hypothetical protein
MNKAENLVEAIQILGRYDDVEMSAEHDVIHIGVPCSIDDEDKQRLKKLGLNYSSEHSSWSMFT